MPWAEMTGPRDLVYIEKRRGPRTEPWGTSVTRGRGVDTLPAQVTWVEWPERYDLIPSRAMPQIPVAAREDRRMEWLTVLKAAERSRRIRTEEREAAWAVCRDYLTGRSAVSVEWPGLKPVGVQQVVLWKKGRELVRGSTFKGFRNK